MERRKEVPIDFRERKTNLNLVGGGRTGRCGTGNFNRMRESLAARSPKMGTWAKNILRKKDSVLLELSPRGGLRKKTDTNAQMKHAVNWKKGDLIVRAGVWGGSSEHPFVQVIQEKKPGSWRRSANASPRV